MPCSHLVDVSLDRILRCSHTHGPRGDNGYSDGSIWGWCENDLDNAGAKTQASGKHERKGALQQTPRPAPIRYIPYRQNRSTELPFVHHSETSSYIDDYRNFESSTAATGPSSKRHVDQERRDNTCLRTDMSIKGQSVPGYSRADVNHHTK